MTTQAKTPLMGIGGISKATGVPVATIRTWERRYGFPRPVRLPSGHRRYSPSLIGHIRLISRALAAGVKASTALALDIEQLRGLVDDTSSAKPVDGGVLRLVESDTPAGGMDIGALLNAIRSGDDHFLDLEMYQARARRTLVQFLTDWVAPLLHAIGEAWHEGTISVSDEHVASERVRAFLAAIWRPMSDRNRGPVVLLSALPGELHDLGLHMAACLVSSAGARVTFLGANVPLDDIASKASKSNVTAVLVSVSAAANQPRTVAAATALREYLPTEMRLAVGGAGWYDTVDGIDNPPGLLGLPSWVLSISS
jgi:methanogenic corrinoid protein MtbC1